MWEWALRFSAQLSETLPDKTGSGQHEILKDFLKEKGSYSVSKSYDPLKKLSA
jgi:hypothetical protein